MKIKKDGLFFYKWSNKQKKYVEKKAKKSNILTYLRNSCYIDEGVTLQDIFNLVDSSKLLKFVISQYSWCPSIDEFHAQAKEPWIKNEEEDLHTLEINWHVSKCSKNTLDFELYPNFHGLGEKTTYSVSYTPVYELAHLPVVLNESFALYDKNVHPKEIFKSTRHFSLLEVLDAIYDDISFVGSPEQNKKFLEELKETVKQIESGLPMVPIEQVAKKLGCELEPTQDEMKMLLHPKIVKQLGVDPNSIPLDDKEIIN